MNGNSPRQENEEEPKNKKLMKKEAQAPVHNSHAPPIVHEILRSPGQSLDRETKAFFQPKFGHDLSQVRVHTDGRATESADAVNALAYTVGNDIVFGAGKYSPKSREGKQLLAHELVHTIQQSEGWQKNTAVLQRQADVRRVPAGLPCVLTTERGPKEDLKLDFGLSSTTLSSAHDSEIDNFVSDWISRGSVDQLRVDGYASVDGPQELNWKVSCDRAEAVKAELIKKGIPENSIIALAHGETSQFSKSSPSPNRRATISRRAVPPAPSLLGRKLGQTPISESKELPANTIKVWKELVGKGDAEGALRAVVHAMEQRGEINRQLMATKVSSRLQICGSANPFILDSTANGAFTSSCGCFDPSGSLLPNPRIRIHPDLISRTSIGSHFPLQTRAEILHSTLLHEFRHVMQFFEECNMSGSAAGQCTDCNDPHEIDAYLSEIEAGYHPTAIRHAWIRVFVNWDYLSQNQQKLLQLRRDTAEKKVNSLFPGIIWNADPEVLIWRKQCTILSGKAGSSDEKIKGKCQQKAFPI